MAAQSTFSYAQAAKGQGNLCTAPANVPAQPSGFQPSLPANASVPTPVPVDVAVESSDTSQNVASGLTSVEKHENASSVGSETCTSLDLTSDKRTGSKREGETGRLDRPWRRGEKDTRSSSTTAHSVDDHDAAGSSSDIHAKSSEKHASDQESSVGKSEAVHEAPKIELSEAPIPSVNIWQQRREAMAKLKSTTATGGHAVNGTLATIPDAKKTARSIRDSSLPATEAASTNGTKQSRKPSEAGRSERNGSRSTRPADKETRDGKTDLPPAVDDTASWPTPETAVKEEKRKPSIAQVDRADKEPKDASEDSSQHKSRQKEKWVAYDYVPSVSFETQLPQMRGVKPRGGARAANGTSRAAGGSQINDKAASVMSATKPSESREWPRDGGPTANRTTSVPPVAKRISVDVPSNRDGRRTSGQASGHVPGHAPSHAPGHALGYAPGDRGKDALTTPYLTEQNHGPRDRPEGRADRGRGTGYRRGSHHSMSMHGQHAHNAAGYAPGPMPSRGQQGAYSPPLRQGGHHQMYLPAPQRGGRGRNGAGANFHRMSLPTASTRLPAVQTQFGPYEYPVAPLSAMPFQPSPYMDNMVLQLLKGQLEYYFSIENLCKDVFLRQRMDSQGYVNLHFVAAFKRIRELTSDMGMIRAVCESSSDIEFVVGDDEVERIRRRSGWEKFVLPMHERDTLARNNGPARLTYKSRAYSAMSQYNGMAPGSYGTSSSGYNGDTHYQPMADMANGTTTGTSQLSADVPDFSPSGMGSLGGIASIAVDGSIDKKAVASAANPAADPAANPAAN